MIQQEKRNTDNTSVYRCRLKAKRRCLRKTLLPGVCRLTDRWRAISIWRPSPWFWDTFLLFLSLQMALIILAKGSPSSHSSWFFFPLWELKSEAQTLNPISFPRTSVSGTSPCHLKSGPSLIIQGQKPSPWCHSDHPGAFFFPLRFKLTFPFLHTLTRQRFSVSSSPASPCSQVWGQEAHKVHFLKLLFFILWQLKLKGTHTFQSCGLQSAHRNMQNQSQRVCLSPFKPLSLYALNSVVRVSQNIYRIWIKKNSFSWWFFFGGRGF